MVFYNSIDELARAVRAQRLAPRDWVFVPLPLRRTVDPAAWAALREELDAIGAHVNVVPGLPRIAVVSFREMSEGMAPPTGARPDAE